MHAQNPLGYERLGKLLARFAVPSVISMLVSALYNIVDQIFIGQGVGYLGNAATNVAFPLTTISLAISLLIGIGSSSRFSLYLGQKRPEKVREITGNALFLMIACGLAYMGLILLFVHDLLFAFGATSEVYPYAVAYTNITAFGFPFLIFTNAMSALIRSDGSPNYSMVCMVVGAIINIVLDPIFIFVFHQGVAGAAWATILGQIISCFVCFAYIPKFKHVEIKAKDIRFSWQATLEAFSIGVSSSVNQIAILFVQIVMNNSMVHYGALSPYGAEIPLAAAGVVMKVNAILFAFMIGLSQGLQPIVGFNYGAKKYTRVKKTMLLALASALVIGALGWTLFEFAPYPVLSLFGSENALYMEFAVHFMKVFLLLSCVNGVQIISSGFFSAIGKPLKGLFLSMIRQVILFIPLAVLLPLSFGLEGILWSAPVADTISFGVAIVLLAVEFHKLDNLQKEND
ncbi:MATE family efflux transporter [Dubosiella muris]|uniref:MATE family efflux transporter n=1 Tax=Dubosiella muris TaxID=3038133 RepID=A0AC61R9R4_9FIRM|nr:MATE family efflux transporter [Dubosiella muris]TGY66832.1 MATE family efflux transporter [Dubosiella muris]